jgi:hypothetical protein
MAGTKSQEQKEVKQKIKIADTDLVNSSVKVNGADAKKIAEGKGWITVEASGPADQLWEVVVATPGREDDKIKYDPKKGKNITRPSDGAVSGDAEAIANAITCAADTISKAIGSKKTSKPE